MQYVFERHWWREAWWAVGLYTVVAFEIAWLFQGGNERLAIAGALLALLGGLALIRPRAAIVLTFVFLAVLGDFRRVLIPLAGWSSQDPLVLVGPAIAVLLFGFIVVGRRLRLDTPLSRWILALMLLMLLQIFNPEQSSLKVGVVGSLYYLVPLLWFWIGRSYATPNFVASLLYKMVVPVAVLAALLGLYQAFYGLLPFEQAWVERVGYAALSVFGETRPFSFFTSAAEYVHWLAIAIVVLWAGWLRGARTSLRIGLVLFSLLGLALFIGSSRAVVIMVLLTLVVLWALQARTTIGWLPRLVLALALVVVGLGWGLSQIPEDEGTGRTEAFVQHQTEGLLNPLDPNKSTARTHVDMLLGGFTNGITEPLGQGLGATSAGMAKGSGSGDPSGGNPGSSKGDDVGGTEVDLSNMFVSLGVAGGIIYTVVIALILVTAIRYWRSSYTLVALAILGVLIVELGQWLNGGHYALSALCWFLIGALDKFERSRRGTVENRSRDAQRNSRVWSGAHKLPDSAGSASRRESGGLGG